MDLRNLKPKPFPESEWRFHKTKEEARDTLNKYFGSEPRDKQRQRMSLGNGAGVSVGISEAVHILGGKYQSGWGITIFPEEW